MFWLQVTIIRQTFQYMKRDVFSAYSMRSHIVYICCVEFQTFRLVNCSIFNILTNVYSEIMYDPTNVGIP